MKRLTILLLMFWRAFSVNPAGAHEVRPAMLDIRQTEVSSYSITWKRPMMGDVGVHLSPSLSTGWLRHSPADRYAAGNFLIESWKISGALPGALETATLSVEGLQGTITDVFVRTTFLDGRRVEGLLRGDDVFHFGGERADVNDRWRFLRLGMEHILSGPDHLLFVFGLLMIAGRGWVLPKTISGFTLAHSITLAIATVWRLDLPVALLDMLIALSILFLAPEIIRAANGGSSVTLRSPIIPAFVFGLLHGLGFATGLTSLDFDRLSLFAALLQFNIGVEIGQLIFVGVIVALSFVGRPAIDRWPKARFLAPSYLIGIAGATWMFQCGATVLAGR